MEKNDFIDKCESLMAQASEHIDSENFRAALKIGEELEKLKFTGAFETQALAYAAMGKKKKAIKILEKGIKIAPDIWLLWQLLGNYYSDEGRFDKSMYCYEKALISKDPDKVSLLYNYANMLKRNGRYDLAETKLAEIFQSSEFYGVDKELAMLCFSLQMGLFNKFERYREAEDAFNDCLKHPSFNTDYSSGFSRVLAEYANTLLKTQRLKEAEEMSVKAIQNDRRNTDAQNILREIRSQNDFSNAIYMRIMVHGKWFESENEQKELNGFFSTYDVVADDEEEALSFIKEIEPKEIRSALKIEEVKILRSPKQPKGIYKTSGYCLYSDEEK